MDNFGQNNLSPYAPGPGMGRGQAMPCGANKELRRPIQSPNADGNYPTIEYITQQTGHLSVNSMSSSAVQSPPASTSMLQNKIEIAGDGFRGGGDGTKWSQEGNMAKALTNLNPLAVEFVPRFIPQTEPESFHASVINGGWSGEDCNSDQEQPPQMDDFVALSELREFIDTVSSKPAKYEPNLHYLTDSLNNWILEDEDLIMQSVVNTIVDQAIMDPNFRYNGARLCVHLIESLNINTSRGSFKDVLIQRIRRGHSTRGALAVATDGGVYLRGFTLFVADFYSRFTAEEIADSLPDLVNTLLSHPTTDNLKCACQVLKLCGSSLEKSHTIERSRVMDGIFEQLEGFITNEDTNKNLKELIIIVTELRKREWHPATTNVNITPHNNPYAFESVATGNSDDSFPTYDFGVCGDEDDNDVCEAFEMFLRESGQLN